MVTTVAIIYATTHGQTQRVAVRLAMALAGQGLQAAAFHVREVPDGIPQGYGGVILAASVHMGRHQREMVRFVRRHRASLQALPNAFVSVSLSQAGADNPRLRDTEREQHLLAVRAMMHRFVRRTRWDPLHMLPVAGALRYTQYGFLLRWMMQRIAIRAGHATDTSRDREYTDWDALDRFAAAFAGELLTVVTSPDPSRVDALP